MDNCEKYIDIYYEYHAVKTLDMSCAIWAGENSHRGEHTKIILSRIYDILSKKLENMN